MKAGVFLVGALAACLIAGGAHAQTSAPAPPDPVRLQLARELFEVSGGRQSVETYMTSLFGSMSKLIDQAMPAVAQSSAKLIFADMQQDLVGMVPELIEVTIPAYANLYTEQELRDYLAWLKSDSGQAIVRKTPLLRQQVLDAEMPLLRAMMPKIMHRTFDRLCDESKCSDKERKALSVVADSMFKAPS